MDFDSKRIFETISGISMSDLTNDVIERTRLYIADYMAACLAGYKINSQFNASVKIVIDSEDFSSKSSVLLADRLYSALNAAFLNAIYAHGADMDDGNKKSAGHIGAHVISAVFALAESLDDFSWGDVILAINIGYELFNRIGGAAQPSLYNKGYHSTGVVGSIACAGACAKLLNLSPQSFYNAVSLAAVQSSGLIIIDESGQSCKPINAANAARVGLLSALIAQKGIDAPQKILESRKGWFNAFASECNTHILTSGIGKKFTILESYLKLYPTCRHTHSCIDAAKKIFLQMQSDGISYQDIDCISLYIYPSAIKSAGSIRHPMTVDEVKFSIPYTISVVLKTGKFSLDDLNRYVHDTEIASLSDIICIHEDESMENRIMGIRGCKLIVKTTNDRIYSEYIPVPVGEGDSILSWTDLETKMMSCGKNILPNDNMISLINQCKHIALEQKFVCPHTQIFIKGDKV